MAAAEDSGWRFHQVFGDKGNVEDITEVDIISAVEFDHTGEFLATGDKGGRVVLFERDPYTEKFAEYQFYTEFQSHEAEFDYLKSLEIEEKINRIKWLKRTNQARFLLSTNDKTIKLWKIYEKQMHSISNVNFPEERSGIRQGVLNLKVPKLSHEDTVYAAIPRRVYANAHAYHINSISVNSDEETFLSADDLRINLWSIGNNKESFMIVDIKPANMEELAEVITAAEFHPTSCNVFMYSSSKGNIKLGDTRAAALCDRHTKVFDEPEDPSQKSFFSEIISSITDVKFSNNGRYIASRDYMTVKVWDINMDKGPVHTFQVHEYLRSSLCDLYENDCIFDKFECSWSHDDRYIMTGSYHHLFHVFDRETNTEVTLEAKTQKKKSPLPAIKVSGGEKKGSKTDIAVGNMDFNRKILHSAFHPQENLVAIAATTNLFMFTKP
eukprot:comp9091_c0_seq1/m.4263 comp9091_c0_seq1/g.4263  ORF comp9091_c0_seq1/g.4263 comp9091_c0_seq1/m.4263 type:complete len:439 (-) comp9091_c0_seq1:669-1985(-)